MAKKIIIEFLIAIALFNSLSATAKHVILNSTNSINTQMNQEGVTYVVQDTIDLNGSAIVVPSNCTIKFKKHGILRNGVFHFNDTYLKGPIRLDCKFDGSITNKEIAVSSFNTDNPVALTSQIESVFNLANHCKLVVDKDITLDGSTRDVRFVALEGNKTIRNSCSYRVEGNVTIQHVSFKDFMRHKETFLDCSKKKKVSTVTINDIIFDGSHNIDRFLYCPYIENLDATLLRIENSSFTKVNNFIVCYRSDCSGVISKNKVYSIGTSDYTSVCVFLLGCSDEKYNANSFIIDHNIIDDVLVPHSKEHNGREAHIFLLYGHNNSIHYNLLSNMYTEQGPRTDTGLDSEGIYIKGGNNVIEGNSLDNCIGSSPDGAITLKTSFDNNRVTNNVIKHSYGVAIQCYTPKSIIAKNKIISTHKAEEGIAMLNNSNSLIVANEFQSIDDKGDFHAAIALSRCEGISIKMNTFLNTSGVITTYKCKGKILFENNGISIKNKVYGENTYYTAPFEIHDDTALFILKGNKLEGCGLRASQLIEAPREFKGALVCDNNTIDIEDSESVKSYINYMVRNIKSLTFNNNIEISSKAKIEQASNMQNSIKIIRH